MEIRSGRIVHKTRGPSPIVVNCPSSKSYLISDNSHTGVDYGGGTNTIRNDLEDIVYTVGPKRFNQCIHSRNSFMYGGDGQSNVRVDFSPHTAYTLYTGYHAHAIAAHSVALSAASTALGGDLSPSGWTASVNDLAVEGFTKMRPDLTELSIPNFIYELDQVKDLFVIWKRNVSLAQNLAGAFLNYKFGWRPTVGDITSMLQAVTGLERKLKLWEQSLGHVFDKRTTLVKRSLSKSGSFNYLNDSHNPISWTVTSVGSIQAFLKYSPQPIVALGGLDKTLRGFLDAFGVELNPRIIWDAIPFTFVIDWFFGVGDFLGRFKVDALELPIHIEDFCLQYKQEWTCQSKLRLDVNADVTPETACAPCQTKITSFHRVPTLPDEASLAGLGWKLPTFNQWELLLALGTVLYKRK